MTEDMDFEKQPNDIQGLDLGEEIEDVDPDEDNADDDLEMDEHRENIPPVNVEVPARSLLCKHYPSRSINCFDTAVQTLRSRVFNRTKNILAAVARAPLYDRKKLSAETQTIKFRQEFQQTSREAGTQPYNPLLYGSEKIKGEYEQAGRATRYVTSDVFLERKLRGIILIQSFIRKYNAILEVEKARQIKYEKQELAALEESRIQAEIERQKQLQLQRRVQPKTQADFQLLQNEIETWARQQKFSIQQTNLPPEARQAALELLVEKEAKLIANVDYLRNMAAKLARSDKVVQFFRRTSEPRQWQLSDGTYVAVNTPYTVRAGVLRDCYFKLEDLTSLDERLDLLLQIKYILKEFDCELTRDTIRLIDEEADLLSRNRPAESLSGLRKRIQNQFLQFCECPEFNPAVQIILNKQDLIYRPNTLPVIEKISQVKKEALGRLKNNELRKGVYGQVDLFKRQFGQLGLIGLLRETEENIRNPKSESGGRDGRADEETMIDIPGAFALVVDEQRFEEDGIKYDIEEREQAPEHLK